MENLWAYLIKDCAVVEITFDKSFPICKGFIIPKSVIGFLSLSASPVGWWGEERKKSPSALRQVTIDCVYGNLLMGEGYLL